MKEFQILDLISDDLYINDELVYVITIYGKTRENENVVCNINDFKPSFYLKFPYHWENNWIKNTFFRERYLDIRNYLTYSCLNNDIKYFDEYNELYGYHIDDNNNEIKNKFMELEFNNYEDMKKVIKIIKNFCKQTFSISEDLSEVGINSKDFIDLSSNEYRGDSNLYEININPLLKFIH
jgi:hypothetical protein